MYYDQGIIGAEGMKGEAPNACASNCVAEKPFILFSAALSHCDPPPPPPSTCVLNVFHQLHTLKC